ncbi:MAG: KilA-N domain-containing protein [Sandarakinorhabdus sp.]|nr:KilA-N domain-containing protein [Sandarakinorhabdus sp.]
MDASHHSKSANSQLELLPHSYQGSLIQQRTADGYINATAMCKAAGRLFADYARLAQTKAFLAELSSVMGIPITELIQSVGGGTPELQGTWVHPQVSIHLAQWASPKFAVQVSQWVVEWMSGIHPADKVWRQFEDRVSLVYDNVPVGYFCVFAQIADLFASMISNGANFGTRMILDLSVGGCWGPHWTKSGYDATFGSRMKFPHNYPSYFPQAWSNPQDAWCYPEDALPTFRRWMREVYIPHKMPKYLRDMVAQKKLPPQIANNALAALAQREANRALPKSA